MAFEQRPPQQQQPIDVEMGEEVSQRQQLQQDQVMNDAGGFVWAVDNMCRLKRFIVMGTEGGTFYTEQKDLEVQNAKALIALIEEGKGVEAVSVIKEYSVENRAAKQDPSIFALAFCARCSHLPTKQAAYDAITSVLRIPTHLFQFVELCETLSKPKTGWGRAHRKAICKWYNNKKAKNLANLVTKYKQRKNWSHRDVFRLCHIKPHDPSIGFVVKYVIKGLDAVMEDAVKPGVSSEISSTCDFLKKVEDAKTMDEQQAAAAIRSHGLVREHIPTNLLNSQEVWKALLENMPMTAMIRNLGKMSSIGILEPNTDQCETVTKQLNDDEALKKARIHPFTVLVALKQYAAGHGDKGSLKWTAQPKVQSALDEAFYKSFKHVKPTHKRFLLALDVSGSMSWGNCIGTPGITPAAATAAMAMVTARTEPSHQFVGFSHQLVDINIEASDKLDTVLKKISEIPMGGTDCSLPMLYAAEYNKEVDVFIIYTDCETYAGKIHPSEALKKYRNKMKINAKLIVVAMTSNGFTLADPDDRGMLDIAGFDSSAPNIIREFVLGNI